MYRIIAPLTLGSQSPRRKELLAEVGLHPTVPSNLSDVEINSGGDIVQLTLTNTVRKFMVLAQTTSDWILTADTMVSLGDKVLGKPADNIEAYQILNALSNKSHQVVTGYTIGQGGQSRPSFLRYVTTEVKFRELSHDEIADYVATGDSLDKAGAYSIQGDAAKFVEFVNGSVSNVIGLPLFETTIDLLRLGIIAFAGEN